MIAELFDCRKTVGFAFSVPFVKGKARYRYSTKSKRTYTPTATIEAETAISEAFLACAGRDFKPVPDGWPVVVQITVDKKLQNQRPQKLRARRDLTRPDLDNVAKLVLDALNGVAYEDDKQVVGLFISRTKRIQRPNDQTRITVYLPRKWCKRWNEVWEVDE